MRTCWARLSSCWHSLTSCSASLLSSCASPIKRTLENCPRLRIEDPLTTFWTETLTLTLTSDLDFQSRESYGHDRTHAKRSRSLSSKVRVEMDRGDCINPRTNAVGKYWQRTYSHMCYVCTHSHIQPGTGVNRTTSCPLSGIQLLMKTGWDDRPRLMLCVPLNASDTDRWVTARSSGL